MKIKIIKILIISIIIFIIGVFFVSLNNSSQYDTRGIEGQVLTNIKLESFSGNKLISEKGTLFNYSWLGILFLAGFTPLPFKLFTITSGIINFNIFIFFIICLIARSLRFFIVAFLSAKFGTSFSLFMEKKGSKWFTIFGIIIVLIATIIYFFYN